MGVKRMLARFPGVAVLQRKVRQERPMDVAPWADVSAVVSAGVVRCRLVHACNARETVVASLGGS